ncbi:hypothetical protein Ahia01_000521000 [Argonauta hians]
MVPQQNNCSKVSGISVKETVEVYDISNEHLETICKAVTDGETLTIKQNKIKKIELCLSENEARINKLVENESPLTNNDSQKNGHKPHRRRPRRRRHGPSFACAPFIQAMDVGSQSDTSTLTSTPKAHPYRNTSDKHIHFASDDDGEEDASITSSNMETKPSNSTPTLSHADIQVPSLKLEKSCIHEKTEPQTDLNNSTSSVRESLLKNMGTFQRRGYSPKTTQISPPTASGDTCSKNKQLGNKNPTSFNTSLLKPKYEDFALLNGSPRVGDKIAFKRLEIGVDYSPIISDFQEATVLLFEEQTKMITLNFHLSQESREAKRIDGKFEVYFEDEDITDSKNESDNNIETVLFSTLMEVKLLPQVIT